MARNLISRNMIGRNGCQMSLRSLYITDPSAVSSSIQNALITNKQTLTPSYRYIQDLRKEKKKVLILGAGYVTPPVVDYLISKGHHVSLVSAIEGEANSLVEKHNFENVSCHTFDCVGDRETLNEMIDKHDLVISLLPYVFHPQVAELAIENKTNMVTASYLSEAMDELNDKAKAAGVTVVNEVGVDPGIDHMLAMELFDELKQNGEDIKSFVSFCGGLPAPEASNNPLGYKFSWSPRGVLLNTVSGAQWLHNNNIDEINAGGDIINKPYSFNSPDEVDFNTWNGFSLEGLPNRDSTKYRDPYHIPKCETLLRGTFRYTGYCSVLRDFHSLNLITEKTNPEMEKCSTWEEFIAIQAGLKGETGQALRKKLANKENKIGEYLKVDKLEELGLLSATPIKQTSCPLDSLADLLNNNCQYGEGEKDAILMRHEVTTHQNPNQVHGVDFIYYGHQGDKNTSQYSAMAQTVGYPCAIAAHLVLSGDIVSPGMVTPLPKDIYSPILEELKLLGIKAKRTITTR